MGGIARDFQQRFGWARSSKPYMSFLFLRASAASCRGRVKTYGGTPRNDGFVMMPNELERYREGPDAFEFKGTNGFMLTVDMTSRDVSTNKISKSY